MALVAKTNVEFDELLKEKRQKPHPPKLVGEQAVQNATQTIGRDEFTRYHQANWKNECNIKCLIDVICGDKSLDIANKKPNP